MPKHSRWMVTLALALAACGGTTDESRGTVAATQERPSHAEGEGGRMAMMCPMRVEGARVSAADIEGGAALVFETDNGSTEELRSRVRRMSEMHNRMHGGAESGTAEAEQPGEDGHAMAGCCAQMHAARAVAVDTPRGARIELRGDDVDALRAEVRRHAEGMQAGQCPMMRMHARR